MKKFLSIVLSILMVVTMIPMSVLPASAAENLDYNIKLEVVDWAVYETSGELIGEFNAVEHGDAFYDVSLTQADDGTFTCSYQIALERNGGNTAWGESSISFKIDSCEDEFMQEFEKSFYSNYNIYYTLKVTRRAGHADGTATCTTQAVCTVCGESYGEVDTTNHDNSVDFNYNGFCENGCYEPAVDSDSDGYYEISNAGQLFWYANYINTVDRTANAVLTEDIDLEGRPWTPIGSTGENSNNFRGIFDGQNYFIRGLYVEGDRAGLGFFGEVRTGTVKNFTIYGEVVVNTEVDYVGGVIGSICGVNGENDLERNGAIIQNIKSFVNLTVKAHGVGKIGGFVGYANHQSLIEKCSWYGTFDAGEYRVDNGAGGFIGRIQENSSEVTIRNCAAYGTIKTNYAGDYNDTTTIYMGGFLSFSNTNAQTTLENCLFAGRFKRGENLTDEAFLGAFGTLRSVKAIENCYYLGDDGLEAVHSDSPLNPESDNVEITKVTWEELKFDVVAKKLGEYWEQGVHYPTLKDHFAHWGSETYGYADNGDGTHDMVCIGCGYVEVYNEVHSGGTATCTEQAECQHCGASYGELDPDNHEYENGFCLPCNSYEKPAIEPGEYDDETWDDTYLISNAGQLYWLAEYVNNVNNEAHAALTADITVPETAPNWVPIGGYYQWTPYTGYFDGRMHTISGLKCETEGYYAGLFGYTDYGNEIKNVGVINSSFKGIDNVGGLIGSSYSYVKNCYVADTTVEGTGYDIGTLIGYNGNEVSNCYTDGGTLIGGDSGITANSYYLSETETEDGGKTEAQFASGEVAYLLQNGVSGEEVYDDEGNYIETVVPHIWGQKIDTDTYPVLGGDKVYQVSDCKNAEAYSNVDKDLGHNYVNGICTVCDEVCGHTGGTTKPTDNGNGTHSSTCAVCGNITEEHAFDENGTCVCGVNLFSVSGSTLTIDGTLGGKETATEEDLAAMVELLRSYIESGNTTIIVTGNNQAKLLTDGYLTPVVSLAFEQLTYVYQDENIDSYWGTVDLIYQDVTEIVEYEFYVCDVLRSITLPKVTKVGDRGFWACYYLETLTFGSVVTDITDNSGEVFYDLGYKIGGCNLVLNCGQLNTATEYQPNLDTRIWWNTEWKSITLTHTEGTAATCTELAVCSVCGESYGELAEHTAEPTYTDNGDGTHKATYSCCGTIVAEGPHTLDITTGKCSACGADMTAIATVTDGTNTYYAADAATLNQAVTAILETGSRTFTVELPADTEA
ncbi:MAG: hypothetical protein J6A85_09015, partial [Clostridia bacterium]|nr:hypothetical protein [Clostridia bacterium]